VVESAIGGKRCDPESGLSSRSTSRGNRATILVAEDDPALRQFLLSVLETNGYRVLGAESGAEAMEIQAKEAGRIDLLLTDWVMPGIDGLELAHRFRNERPDAEVLLTTGYANLFSADREAPFPVIEKPFTVDSLLAEVGALLADKRQQATVLIADDAPEVRRFFSAVLTSEGYRVLECACGAEAERHIARGGIDLAILDLFMPEGDGLEVIHKLRRRKSRPKILALSGEGDEYLDAAYGLGADLALMKPVPPVTLLNVVRQLLAWDPAQAAVCNEDARIDPDAFV